MPRIKRKHYRKLFAIRALTRPVSEKRFKEYDKRLTGFLSAYKKCPDVHFIAGVFYETHDLHDNAVDAIERGFFYATHSQGNKKLAFPRRLVHDNDFVLKTYAEAILGQSYHHSVRGDRIDRAIGIYSHFLPSTNNKGHVHSRLATLFAL